MYTERSEKLPDVSVIWRNRLRRYNGSDVPQQMSIIQKDYCAVKRFRTSFPNYFQPSSSSIRQRFSRLRAMPSMQSPFASYSMDSAPL